MRRNRLAGGEAPPMVDAIMDWSLPATFGLIALQMIAAVLAGPRGIARALGLGLAVAVAAIVAIWFDPAMQGDSMGPAVAIWWVLHLMLALVAAAVALAIMGLVVRWLRDRLC